MAIKLTITNNADDKNCVDAYGEITTSTQNPNMAQLQYSIWLNGQKKIDKAETIARLVMHFTPEQEKEFYMVYEEQALQYCLDKNVEVRRASDNSIVDISGATIIPDVE